ncbi:MAG: redoxin family protein [Nitrospirae bacterium]|nr:redoxin family protein [Nitrospirota bacterium]
MLPCASSSAEFERISPFTTEKLLNTAVPDFSLSDKTSLSAFRGSVLLIVFWSDRCPACMPDRESLKHLRIITDQSILKIISIHAGKPGSQHSKASAPEGLVMIYDSSLEITLGKFNVTSLPAAILVDKNDMVIKIFRGQQNWTDSKRVQEIEDLIKLAK